MAKKSPFHQVYSLDMSLLIPTNCNVSFNFIRLFASMVPNVLELDLSNIITPDALDFRLLFLFSPRCSCLENITRMSACV